MLVTDYKKLALPKESKIKNGFPVCKLNFNLQINERYRIPYFGKEKFLTYKGKTQEYYLFEYKNRFGQKFTIYFCKEHLIDVVPDIREMCCGDSDFGLFYPSYNTIKGFFKPLVKIETKDPLDILLNG